LYARPNDTTDFALKICELLDNPQRRDAMGALGRARVEGGLAWHHQVPRLLAAYTVAMTSNRQDP
jgi:glycosyltransferase involved in cell wall biosynthesis